MVMSHYYLPLGACASICTHTECFDEPGSFSSLKYPTNYPSDLKQSWLITAPQGRVVTLNFDSNFEIDSSADSSCPNDYVVIYDGAFTTDAEIGRYCGITGPGLIKSLSYNLLVTFTTDGATQFSGFSATFDLAGKRTISIAE